MNIKNYSSIFAVLLAVFFTACQTESTTEVHSTKETITKTTPLSTYIERVAMQKTSQDNIIDNTNCFMIKLPYVVTVNSIQITIKSSSDYLLVQNNINAYLYDNDIVTIQFPVVVVMNDYSEKTLTNQTDFNNLISLCQASTATFGKINCIAINYPIVINIYDSNNQIASTTSIANNQSLFDFFDNLEDNQFVAINYPINITNSNGVTSTITSNNQFEDSIKATIDTCTENASSALDFVKILTLNRWKISYCYYDNYEKTSVYDGYTFVFDSNYKAVATKAGITYNGTWSTKVDNGMREFRIIIEPDPLKKLDEGWKVFEFNDSQLRFRDSDGSNESDYLYFQKI